MLSSELFGGLEWIWSAVMELAVCVSMCLMHGGLQHWTVPTIFLFDFDFACHVRMKEVK
jgi:hypothetical protein